MIIPKKNVTLRANNNFIIIMNEILKYLGVLLSLLAVICIVVYKFAPTNGLLVAAIVLVVCGILSHILINKYIQ